MASAKYTKGAKGSYQARVWDGTYDEHGRKHRMVSKVSGTMKYDRGQKKLVRHCHSQSGWRIWTYPAPDDKCHYHLFCRKGGTDEPALLFWNLCQSQKYGKIRLPAVSHEPADRRRTGSKTLSHKALCFPEQGHGSSRSHASL